MDASAAAAVKPVLETARQEPGGMTADHFQGIEKFEADLWKIADNLRANSNLASNEYFMPIMGLIFLRHATNRFYEAKAAIEADKAAGKMPNRPLVEADFSRALNLPESARFDVILKTPKDGNLGAALNTAMEAIEVAFPPLAVADAVEVVYSSDEAKQRFEILARQVFIRFKALLMEPTAFAYAERRDNIEAIYKKLTERRDTADVTELRRFGDNKKQVPTVREGYAAILSCEPIAPLVGRREDRARLDSTGRRHATPLFPSSTPGAFIAHQAATATDCGTSANDRTVGAADAL
jgi:HsdM N-terminal domain